MIITMSSSSSRSSSRSSSSSSSSITIITMSIIIISRAISLWYEAGDAGALEAVWKIELLRSNLLKTNMLR